MSGEGQNIERKSLRIVTGRRADWDELAKDCVAFANAQGGRLLIGIEDGEIEPPAARRLPADLPEKILKRVGELTVNVTVAVRDQRRAIRWGISGGAGLALSCAGLDIRRKVLPAGERRVQASRRRGDPAAAQ